MMTVEDAKPDVATHKLTTRHSLSPQPSCKQTRLHSCHHSRGFAVKARISSSESNTCRRLLFSAHLFLLALCSTHRAGDFLLITSSSSSGSCRGIYFLPARPPFFDFDCGFWWWLLMLILNWCGSFSFDPWIILELGWFHDCSWGFLFELFVSKVVLFKPPDQIATDWLPILWALPDQARLCTIQRER